MKLYEFASAANPASVLGVAFQVKRGPGELRYLAFTINDFDEDVQLEIWDGIIVSPATATAYATFSGTRVAAGKVMPSLGPMRLNFTTGLAVNLSVASGEKACVIAVYR